LRGCFLAVGEGGTEDSDDDDDDRDRGGRCASWGCSYASAWARVDLVVSIEARRPRAALREPVAVLRPLALDEDDFFDLPLSPMASAPALDPWAALLFGSSHLRPVAPRWRVIMAPWLHKILDLPGGRVLFKPFVE
jgi:hypothetical protein